MKRARLRSIFVPGRVSRISLNAKDILCVRLQVIPSEQQVENIRQALNRVGLQRYIVVGPDVEIARIRGG